MAKRYDAKIYNECKRLFVEQGLSPKSISEQMGGTPAKQTITLWAKKKDSKGKTWKDYRIEYRDKLYESISPQNIAGKLMERILQLLNSEEWTDKSADQLAKLHSTLQKILEPKFQIPTMYHMLTELSAFLQQYYPDLATPKFFKALVDFKNDLRMRIEKNPL